jgi:hypothetical protein
MMVDCSVGKTDKYEVVETVMRLVDLMAGLSAEKWELLMACCWVDRSVPMMAVR